MRCSIPEEGLFQSLVYPAPWRRLSQLSLCPFSHVLPSLLVIMSILMARRSCHPVISLPSLLRALSRSLPHLQRLMQLLLPIRSHNRCWRCARSHLAAQCDLKKPCILCCGTHLRSLHDVNICPSSTEDTTTVEKSCFTSFSSDMFFLDKPSVSGRVTIKVVPVHLSYEDCTPDTFALLDDGSESTILLSAAVEALGIQGVPEDLPLRTVMFRLIVVVPLLSRFPPSIECRLVIRSVTPLLLIALTCRASCGGSTDI